MRVRCPGRECSDNLDVVDALDTLLLLVKNIGVSSMVLRENTEGEILRVVCGLMEVMDQFTIEGQI